MTREEEIRNKAVNEQRLLMESMDYRAGFMSGAKWADENPNLYNDEKYHTVKVSCLDELNKKAVLYDEFLEKACDYLYKLNQMNFNEYGKHCPLVNVSDFRKAMEE